MRASAEPERDGARKATSVTTTPTVPTAAEQQGTASAVVSSPGVSDTSARESGPSVLLTKLHPPAARDHTLGRARLLERLGRGSGRRLTLVAAPAGCGKTTLLAAWREVEATRRPVGWLTLDEGDNDPVVLWSHAIEALRRVSTAVGESISPMMVGTASIVDVVLRQLVNELAEQDPTGLILDDFHRLSSGAARDSVAWFVEHAPSTFQLVLSTRSEPALPLARLRAHGELVELRAEELRFSSAEADALLNDRLELGLAREDVDDLVERTEGWPAGLYLAGLSLAGVADRHAFVRSFGATSRHVVDFLVDEVLETYDPANRELMLRSSILERLCGPLCDAILEQEGGASEMLGQLSRTNLFLISLDEHGQWYRFHHLFAQLLRVELERREPELAQTLHRRAYMWHRDRGTTDEAIHHALEARAFAEAGELIAGSWPYYANVSRYATVLTWLRRFPDEVLHGDVRLLLVKAWVLSLSALREEAAQAIAAAEQLGGVTEGPLPDGFSSIEASLALLRAVFPWGDIGAELENARRAAELEGPESPWRPVACFTVGWGLYFRGEPDQADRWFEECVALAPASEQWLVCGASLAYRSLIAGEGGRLEEQRDFAEQAEELAREHDIGEVDGEIPLAVGVSLAARGRLEEARAPIERAIAVARSWGQPLDLAKALLRQASLLRALGEPEHAAGVIAEARSILASCPDPGILTERLAALERSQRTRPRLGDGELTERELAVLRLLSGGLSEREVGRELYVSHSTVHTHTKSVYRKLGVSSRAEALEQARVLGLL